MIGTSGIAVKHAAAVEAEEVWFRSYYPDDPAKAEAAIARAHEMSRENGMTIDAAFRSVRNQIAAKWWVPS